MPTPAPGFSVRPYRSEDLGSLYNICLKTGDNGEDATHLYNDPQLLGHLYAAPYAVLEPDLTFVLEDAEGVCSYILGAFDSKAFDERLGREWLPGLRERYPQPAGNPQTWTRDERMINGFYEDRSDNDDLLPDYPSHLHIDLLPRAQGRGNGHALMETLLAALKSKGSPGVHLGTSPRNVRAERFYKKMGFHELKRQEPHVLVMGKRLAAGSL